MKKATTLFAAILLLAVGATAQKLSYQAVVRNNANELVTETTVQVAVTVLNANNAVQYAEMHANVQTNRNGLLSLMIGDGVPTGSATLAGVEWPGASLRTVITLPDNTTITNVTPVNSVPYALYADNVDPDMVSNAIAEYIASHSIGGEDNVQADWNETNQNSDAFIWNKPSLFSGDYNDLTNKPAINNGTLTLQQNGSNVGTFTANQGTDQTLNITTLTAAEVQTMINSGLADLQHRLDSLQTVVDIMNGAFVCGTSTVTDHEGNVYNTVKIGNQCWTKENLRTTTSPSTGTYLIPAAGTGSTYTGKQAFWYNNDSATYAPMNYGLLYNWNAAVDTFNTAYGETSVNGSSSNAVSVTFNGHRRGICPAGWHLPSDAEWTVLTDYVRSQSEYQCGGNRSYIAKALSSSTDWYYDADDCDDSCAVGNDSGANNATGFSAVPAGYCFGSESSFLNAGLGAFFWSPTLSLSLDAYYRNLISCGAYVIRGSGYKSDGLSVRCLRDETGGGSGTTATLPTVTTGSVSDVTATSAMCGAEVTADGGAEVTARGVCWGTSETPTVADAHTSDGTGIGTFTSSISGLSAGTTYYVRAYATNSEGTAYGDQLTFVTSSGTTPTPEEGDAIPCPAAPTVTDHEGNVYATVQIGNQCWMRDNLRTTTSPSTGTYLIPASGTDYTYTGKQAFWYNNDSATYAPMNYGLLYNWNAAVDTFNTAYGETSVTTSGPNFVSVTFSGHRRGICPVGWHLPNDAEWTQLENYVGSQSKYTCGGDSSYIAKALASTEGWNSYGGECYLGDQSVTANNATGFSAVPAGGCGGSSFYRAGYDAYFWSSTQYYSNYAYYRYLLFDDAYVSRDNYFKLYGFSVRCLRD